MEEIKTKKGHLILGVVLEEIPLFGSSLCLCDGCNNGIKDKAYYVGVLNYVMCPDCYKEWEQRAKYYEEDREFEQRKIDAVKKCILKGGTR